MDDVRCRVASGFGVRHAKTRRTMAARTSVKQVSVLRHARLHALQAPAVGEDAASDGQRGGVRLAEHAAVVRQERPVRPRQPAIPC